MATVIRRGQAPPMEPFAFQDVERQARELLASARAQAQHLLGEAQRRGREYEEQACRRVALLEEEARARGLAVGLAEGREKGFAQARQEAQQAALEEARAELRRLADALTAGLSDYTRSKRRLLAAAESGLIELALAIARRVCKVQVAASVEPARENCRALLELVKHNGDVVVSLNPTDYERLGVCAADFLGAVASLEHVRVQADPQVSPGGCVLHTADGVLDASIEGQLDRIATALGLAGTTGS